MSNVRYYLRPLHIQDGRAIISLVMRNDIKLYPHVNQFLEWVGDAYLLRAELNELIRVLEDKHTRRVGPRYFEDEDDEKDE